jgi:hypothetical protein
MSAVYGGGARALTFLRGKAGSPPAERARATGRHVARPLAPGTSAPRKTPGAARAPAATGCRARVRRQHTQVRTGHPMSLHARRVIGRTSPAKPPGLPAPARPGPPPSAPGRHGLRARMADGDGGWARPTGGANGNGGRGWRTGMADGRGQRAWWAGMADRRGQRGRRAGMADRRGQRGRPTGAANGGGQRAWLTGAADGHG